MGVKTYRACPKSKLNDLTPLKLATDVKGGEGSRKAKDTRVNCLQAVPQCASLLVHTLCFSDVSEFQDTTLEQKVEEASRTQKVYEERIQYLEEKVQH